MWVKKCKKKKKITWRLFFPPNMPSGELFLLGTPREKIDWYSVTRPFCDQLWLDTRKKPQLTLLRSQFFPLSFFCVAALFLFFPQAAQSVLITTCSHSFPACNLSLLLTPAKAENSARDSWSSEHLLEQLLCLRLTLFKLRVLGYAVDCPRRSLFLHAHAWIPYHATLFQNSLQTEQVVW